MDEHEQQALIKALEQLKDGFIGNQGTILAVQYVVKCLCANLPPADAAALRKKLQEAREALAGAVDPINRTIVQELASFELILSGMATPVLH